MSGIISIQEIIVRLIVAALFGCIVGLERERLNWVAGMRTHMLVCLGSALIMMVSMFGFSDVLGQKDVVLDPSRVAAQVVSGIGFLGAGTIFFWRKEVIRGLTTAAGLWAVAGIGLAIGGGMYLAGAAATILVLVILALMKPVEKMIFSEDDKQQHTLSFRASKSIIDLAEIKKELELLNVKIVEIKTSPVSNGHKDALPQLDISIIGVGSKMIDFISQMNKDPNVESVSFA